MIQFYKCEKEEKLSIIWEEIEIDKYAFISTNANNMIKKQLDF